MYMKWVVTIYNQGLALGCQADVTMLDVRRQCSGQQLFTLHNMSTNWDFDILQATYSLFFSFINDCPFLMRSSEICFFFGNGEQTAQCYNKNMQLLKK